MASSAEFVNFVCEQIAGAGEITSRRMFGEYGIYVDGKFVAMICDDQFFVKVSEKGKEVIEQGSGLEEGGEVVLAPPYEGGTPCFLIENLESREFLTALLIASYEDLPMQKRKAKKKQA